MPICTSGFLNVNSVSLHIFCQVDVSVGFDTPASVGPQLQLRNAHAVQQPFLLVYLLCLSPEAEGSVREISAHTTGSQSVICGQQGHPKQSVAPLESCLSCGVYNQEFCKNSGCLDF